MSRAADDDHELVPAGWRRGRPVPTPRSAARRSPVVKVADYTARKAEPGPARPPESPADDMPDLQIDAATRAPVEPPADIRVAEENPPIGRRSIDGAAILDLRTLLRAVWTHRLLIVGLMAVFAMLGGLLVPLAPKTYTAQTSLYFDPRQIELTDTNSQNAISSEVIVSMINSQAKILTSPKVIGAVVDRLKLSDSPVFSRVRGEPDERKATIVGLIQRAATVDLETSSYVVTLSVATADGGVSAEIANALVGTFLEEENRAFSSLYQTTNSALDSRLRELSEEVQQAEEAVETYKASNDMVTADGNLIADQRLVQLNELLTTTQKASIEAKAKLDAAAKLKLEDAISTNSQSEISATLTDLRRQYATQAAAVGSLASSMGARHPSLLAAQASLQGLKGEIEAELQRNLARAKADLAQTQQAEQQVAKELAVQKSLQNNTLQRQVGLNDLQRRATAARDIYEAVLKRVRETSEEKNLARSNIRVLSEASPPAKADGPGRSMLLVAGIVAGSILGFGLGLLIALARSLAANPRFRAGFADLTRTP
ncbi:GumC family protein [Rhizobium sp. TRM95111]|uniref:GumC family protein n=1 Tax=Rhizobium alarense TaxID=2846851 RepID=UPI001F40B16F|nr:GumC family protein [Rhizobium alarense]MCF3640454.1 GumC family protein [Rhizobium alarense]